MNIGCLMNKGKKVFKKNQGSLSRIQEELIISKKDKVKLSIQVKVLEQENKNVLKIKDEVEDLKAFIEQLEEDRALLCQAISKQKEEYSNFSKDINQLTMMIGNVQKASEDKIQYLENELSVLRKKKGGVLEKEGYRELKKLNDYLLEKEDLLEYELAKSKAHSLALERVYQDLVEEVNNRVKSCV